MAVITTTPNESVCSLTSTSTLTEYVFSEPQSDLQLHNTGKYKIDIKIKALNYLDIEIFPGESKTLNNEKVTAIYIKSDNESTLSLLSCPWNDEDNDPELAIDSLRKSLKEVAKHCSPTGTADDTSYLQNIVNNYSHVVLKAGTYYINAVTKLTIPSNRRIVFEEGATLQALKTDNGSYQVVYINNATNVTLINPTVIGDRDAHTAVDGEHGHGIVITGTSNNIKVYNATCKKCWGDGFVIYGGNNIYVENLLCDYNRRLGLTITNGTNITVVNPKLMHSDGVAPMSGMDIEPNYATDIIDNVKIINPYTAYNSYDGIIINLAKFKDSAHTVNILIENHIDVGSSIGFECSPTYGFPDSTAKISGKITYKNGRCIESAGMGISACSTDNWPLIELINPYILNCNTSADSSPGVAIGIGIIGSVNNTAQNGNVHLINPIVIDNRETPLILRGIKVTSSNGLSMKNVVIIDPLKVEGVLDSQYNIGIAAGVTMSDKFKQSYYVNGTQYNKDNYNFTYLTNDGAPDITPYTLKQFADCDCPITFVNTTSYGVKITPQTGVTISPLSTTPAQAIQTTQLGASITLKQLDSTHYIITNMIGTWAVV